MKIVFIFKQKSVEYHREITTLVDYFDEPGMSISTEQWTWPKQSVAHKTANAYQRHMSMTGIGGTFGICCWGDGLRDMAWLPNWHICHRSKEQFIHLPQTNNLGRNKHTAHTDKYAYECAYYRMFKGAQRVHREKNMIWYIIIINFVGICIIFKETFNLM